MKKFLLSFLVLAATALYASNAHAAIETDLPRLYSKYNPEKSMKKSTRMGAKLKAKRNSRRISMGMGMRRR